MFGRIFSLILILFCIFTFVLIKVKYFEVNENKKLFAINEECMIKLQKSVGLINYYNDKKAVLNHEGESKLKIPEIKEYFGEIFHGEMRMSREDNFYLLQIGEPVLTQHYKIPYSIWRSDMLFFGTNVPDIKYSVIGCFYVIWIFLYWAFAFYLYEINLNRKICLIVMVLFVLFFAYMEKSDVKFTLEYSNFDLLFSEIQKDSSSQTIKNLSSMSTQIINRDDKRNPLNFELLIGGTDFFDENFLCWKIGDYQYLYFFINADEKTKIVSSLGNIEKITSNIYKVCYYDNINQERYFFSLYVFFIIAIIVITVFYLHKCHMREK